MQDKAEDCIRNAQVDVLAVTQRIGPERFGYNPLPYLAFASLWTSRLDVRGSRELCALTASKLKGLIFSCPVS